MSVEFTAGRPVNAKDLELEREEIIQVMPDGIINAASASDAPKSLQGRVTVDHKILDFSDLDLSVLKQEFLLAGFSEDQSEELCNEFKINQKYFDSSLGFQKGNILHLLAAYGDREDVSMLLKKSPDASSFNEFKKAPVMFATKFENQEVVDLFVEQKIACKPYLVNIAEAVEKGNLEELRLSVRALCSIYQVSEDDANQITNKILDIKNLGYYESSICELINSMKFVDFVSAFGSQQSLEIALSFGEDLTLGTDYCNDTTAMFSAYYGNSETLTYLLSMDVDLNLGMLNHDGETPGYTFLRNRNSFENHRYITSLFLSKGYDFLKGFNPDCYSLSDEDKAYIESFQGRKAKRA